MCFSWCFSITLYDNLRTIWKFAWYKKWNHHRHHHHIHHHDNNHCQNHANHQQFNIIIFMIIILPKSWEEADRQRAEDQSQEVESSKQIDYFWSKIIWNYDTNSENCLHNWYYISLQNLNKIFWQDQRKICIKSKWSYISW